MSTWHNLGYFKGEASIKELSRSCWYELPELVMQKPTVGAIIPQAGVCVSVCICIQLAKHEPGIEQRKQANSGVPPWSLPWGPVLISLSGGP